MYKGYENEINMAVGNAYNIEMEKVNSQLEKEIMFILIGDVNSGKSTTINKLIGDNVARAGSKPGETMQIAKYSYKDKIVFVDTPGLNDINKANSQETLGYLRNADIILYFLNAAGTVLSNSEKESLDKIKKDNSNIIIVLNKIDAADDVGNIINFIKNETDNEIKIIPISSRTGQNVDELRSEILDVLKKKSKDILFARTIQEKSSIAKKWIMGAATSAGAIGMAPIPGSDIIPITSIQVGLLTKLATIYERPLKKEVAKELILATFAGNIGKSVFRQIVKTIPVLGPFAGAGIAAAMTAALGYSVKHAYENNIDLDVENLLRLYKMFYNKKQI